MPALALTPGIAFGGLQVEESLGHVARDLIKYFDPSSTHFWAWAEKQRLRAENVAGSRSPRIRCFLRCI